jgi:hypothetical protein
MIDALRIFITNIKAVFLVAISFDLLYNKYYMMVCGC